MLEQNETKICKKKCVYKLIYCIYIYLLIYWGSWQPGIRLTNASKVRINHLDTSASFHIGQLSDIHTMSRPPYVRPFAKFRCTGQVRVDIDLRALITDNQPRKLAKNVKLSILIRIWENTFSKTYWKYIWYTLT